MTSPETKVLIELEDLKLLCLNIDYGIHGECRDLVEELSVELQKKHKFDSHEFRHALAKRGIVGAV